MKELDLKAGGAFAEPPMISVGCAPNSSASVLVKLVYEINKRYDSQDNQVGEPAFVSFALHTEDHSDTESPAVSILDMIDIHLFIFFSIGNVSYVLMPLHEVVIFL